MGIAAFIIGLSCTLLAPLFNVYLILPSILGLALGIADTVLRIKRNAHKKLSIAGIILSGIALLICIISIIALYFYVAENIETSLYENTIDENSLFYTDVSAGLGESATLDDITATFDEVDFDYTDYKDSAYIPDGYKILKATFTLENIGNTSTIISYKDFECYVDSTECSVFYDSGDKYSSASVASEESDTISIYFQIPEDTDSIEIYFDSNSYDDAKIIFYADDDSEE